MERPRARCRVDGGRRHQTSQGAARRLGSNGQPTPRGIFVAERQRHHVRGPSKELLADLAERVIAPPKQRWRSLGPENIRDLCCGPCPATGCLELPLVQGG